MLAAYWPSVVFNKWNEMMWSSCNSDRCNSVRAMHANLNHLQQIDIHDACHYNKRHCSTQSAQLRRYCNRSCRNYCHNSCGNCCTVYLIVLWSDSLNSFLNIHYCCYELQLHGLYGHHLPYLIKSSRLINFHRPNHSRPRVCPHTNSLSTR